MSQETPSKQPTSIPLADAILAVGQGDLSHRVLISFADLDRAKAEQLRHVWSLIDSGYRVRLIRALFDLSEESVLYDFNRVFRIGLEDEEVLVRQGSIAGLWEDSSSDLLNLLLGMLDDESQDIRAEAAQALGRFAVLAASDAFDKTLCDQLFQTLDDIASDPSQPYLVRRRGLESLASFGNRGNIYALIREAIDEDDHGLRAGALFAMGRTLDARWLDIISSEFESDDPEMRYEAARAAGEIGDSNAIGGLAALCADPDAEVRFAAVSALGTIGNPASLRILRRLAERASGEEREAIEEAIQLTDSDDDFPAN